MNSTQNETIADEEFLFRAVRPMDLLWDFDNNRPAPSLFQNKNGVSVDRQGIREISEILLNFSKLFTEDCGIVKIAAGKCRQLDTHPIAKPSKHNSHHAEIHDSPTQILIEPEKREQLAKNVVIVKLPVFP